MYWIILALIAPMLWAVGDVAEKYQLDKIFKDWLSYFALMYIIWSGFVAAIFVYHPIMFNFFYIGIAVISGFIGTIAVIFYLKAVSKEEASRVVPLSYIGMVFIVIFAYIFLHETFTLGKYAGIACLTIGAIMISYKKIKGKLLPLTPVLSLILLSAFIEAIANTLNKFFLLKYNYWSLLFWGYFGGLGVIIFLLTKKENRKRFYKISKLKLFQWAIIAIVTVIYYTGDIVWFAALSEAPLSLVAALSTTEPFFVLVITILLSLFMPKILKEEISKSTVSLKLISIILIMLGTYLIAV